MLLLICCVRATAQQKQGSLSGSFETNTIYYVNDSKTNATVPQDNYGSNNYLKLDYRYGRLSAGLQAEWFPQPLQGYSTEWKGYALASKYVMWTGKTYSVTIGDWYDQFGSGLLFRAWEDRTLGLNNSIGGARFVWQPIEALAVKAVWGFPRDYIHSTYRGYKELESLYNNYTDTQIAGVDLSIGINQLLGIDSDHRFTIEGSVLERMEQSIPEYYRVELIGFDVPKNNLSYSARIGYNYQGLSVKGEYVGKQNDYFDSPITLNPELRSGNAQLVEANYSTGGLSASVMFRRLDNMVNKAYRSATSLESNTLNYLPALCQQHVYLLTTLQPYYTNTYGETGGQIDLYYMFGKGSKIGGKRGLKLHANMSTYYSLKKYDARDKNSFLFRDVTVDVEKSWNRKLKTILYMTIQEYSPTHGEHRMTEVQNIIVADVQYKFTSTLSLRGELQYLYSKEGDGDWTAGLLELNLAPRWSLFGSDMYNQGNTKVNYYSGGVSYTYGAVRVAASYGRNRAGMVCSGGVCRWQPAYTGGNLAATIIF